MAYEKLIITDLYEGTLGYHFINIMSFQGRRSSLLSIDAWLDECSSNEPDSIVYEPEFAKEVAESARKQDEAEDESVYRFVVEECTKMGLSPNKIEENITDARAYLKTCRDTIRQHYQEGSEKLCHYEQDLLAQVTKMTNDLYLPPYERDGNLTLIQHCKYLKGKFNELNRVRENRMSKLQELRDKQLKQCTILGIRPPQLKHQTDIPTEEELTKLAGAVVELVKEEQRRREKYNILRDMITKCMDQLEISPKDDFERGVLESRLDLRDENLHKMSNLHSELEARYAKEQEKYDQLKQRLISLYDRLDVPQSDRDKFLDAHNVCKPTLMDEMKEEIEKREEEKKQNIGKFIAKIKKELEEEYGRCYVTQEEQDHFFSLSSTSDGCNEELLELYERELERVKQFYETNKKILDKFNNWLIMWNELLELEMKANDPNRFNNRGGQLLLEEKKRKALQKGLPKVEKELNEMNGKWSADNNGAKFKVYGKDIDDYVDDRWNKLNTAKEEEKRERQRAKMTEGANKNRKVPQVAALVGRTPTKRPASRGVTPTPTKLQRSVLGTPSHQNAFRPNQMVTSGSVKKAPQGSIFQNNKIAKPAAAIRNTNDKSNIPVFNHNLRSKNLTSNGSESSALSLSEQEFEDMIVTCPASAKRHR